MKSERVKMENISNDEKVKFVGPRKVWDRKIKFVGPEIYVNY